VIDKHRTHLLEVNTWGDGFFILSNRAQGLAELALDLRDFFRKCSWGDYALPELKIRIALHAAEVYLYPNRIKGKTTKDSCNAPRISREVLPLGFVVKREAVPGCRRGLSACWSVAVLARSGGGLIPGCAQAVLRQ
jgi:hypothetical protein